MTFILNSQNIFDYLIDKEICTSEQQSSSQIELIPAKNFNLLFSMPSGRKLLVKQERQHAQAKTISSFLREWQIQQLLQRFSELRELSLYVSEAIYYNMEESVIIFNYLSNYQDLAEFYTKTNSFPTVIASRIGAIIALIHRLTFDREDFEELFKLCQVGVSNPIFELTTYLRRITPEVFGEYPDDGLKFFALYQRYDSLGQAIAELGNVMEIRCLIHNDLKLNNILLSNNWESGDQSETLDQNMIRLIDWESSTWGDPASDLGMLIGNYLKIWLSSLMTSQTMTLEESLRLATTPLEKIQPSIAALIRAYLDNFPEILEYRPGFLLQVVQCSGVALMQSILATLQHQKSFGHEGICMLQVAKSLLCRPQQSVSTVFGMTLEELTKYQTIKTI